MLAMYGGWWRHLSVGENDKPKLSWGLIRRVLKYAKPHRVKIIGVLACIITSTMLGLVTPLLFRQLIDVALKQGNVQLLDTLALGIILIPLGNGLISVVQRYLKIGRASCRERV